jgi:hypothetical protein
MKALLSATLAAAFMLSGCTSTMTPIPMNTGKISRIDEKSYTKGVSRAVYVGDAIVSRKAFDASISTDYMMSTEAFQLSGGALTTALNVTGRPGDKFRIIGTNENGNFVLAIPGSHLAFGVNTYGYWDNTVVSQSYWTSPIGSGSQYSMTPNNARFSKSESVMPLSTSAYINHELVFTGLGADGIHVLYREYTFENVARQAFSQELVYPANSGQIRFKNYVFDVKNVTSSEITVVITQD